MILSNDIKLHGGNGLAKEFNEIHHTNYKYDWLFLYSKYMRNDKEFTITGLTFKDVSIIKVKRHKLYKL